MVQQACGRMRVKPRFVPTEALTLAKGRGRKEHQPPRRFSGETTASVATACNASSAASWLDWPRPAVSLPAVTLQPAPSHAHPYPYLASSDWRVQLASCSLGRTQRVSQRQRASWHVVLQWRRSCVADARTDVDDSGWPYSCGSNAGVLAAVRAADRHGVDCCEGARKSSFRHAISD
eukprot:COSAG01_NODE_3665_length_5813_cov_11.013126_3_plen_177_part_00